MQVKEKTFSSYNQGQGQTYSEARPDYSPELYSAVLQNHLSTGGGHELLVDVGCGPGLAARGLASHFQTVVGLDPSSGMIETGRSKGGVSASGSPIRYEVSSAEDLGASLSPPIAPASVDLITASNAAHWFDMAPFWASAARVLKPGGTVALWTGGPVTAHPDMPNAAKIQAAMDEYHDGQLGAYRTEGNRLTKGRYADLPLPWTVSPPIEEFDKAAFVRREWKPDETFFVGGRSDAEHDFDMFEKVMATGSAQTRWEQAHPEDAGTERDPLKMVRAKIEGLLREGGVQPGQEKFRGTSAGTLLVFKRA